MRMHGFLMAGATFLALSATLIFAQPARAQSDQSQSDQAWKRPAGPAPNWLTAGAEQWARQNETRKALAKKVSFDFNGVALTEVAKEIGRQIGVPIHFNHVELDNCGHSADEPITAQGKEVRLSELREQILQPLDLNWRINESDIEITSNDDVSSEPVLMVYDLAYKSNEPVNLERLIDLISQTIDIDEWMDYGGTGCSTMLPFGSAIVVFAPDSTHRKVTEFISQLNKLPTGKEDLQWQLPVGLQIMSTEVVKTGERLRSGKINLTLGINCKLVKLVEDKTAGEESKNKPAPNDQATKWSQPSAPTPAWLGPNLAAEREEVLAKLRQTVSIDVDGQPLSEALAILFKAPGVDYWIDAVELDNAGQSIDAPVSISLQQASLSEVLQRMLRPLDLTYRIDGHRVEITSTDDANSTPVTRVYDMAYLSEKPFDLAHLCRVIAATVDPDEWRDYAGTGDATLIPSGSQLFISAPETTFLKLDALLYQLTMLHPDNLPLPKAETNSGMIEVEVRSIPAGSTIEIPTEGHYELRVEPRAYGGVF